MNWQNSLKIFCVRHLAQLPAYCDRLLRLSGWLTICALCTAGLWAIVFVVLGGLDSVGFALQFDNFVHHYLAAEPADQAVVRDKLNMISLALFALTAFFRRHSLDLGPCRKEARYARPIPKTAH